MEVKCQLIRVYGLENYQAIAPSLSPNLEQASIHDYPQIGDSLSILVSNEIPEKIVYYHALSAASIVTWHNRINGYGDVSKSLDDEIQFTLKESQYAKQFKLKEYPYYFLNIVERRICLETTAILKANSQYVWIDAEQSGQEFLTYKASARKYLNSVDTYISFLFGNHFTENLVLNNLQIWSVQNEPVIKFPISSGSVKLGKSLNNQFILPGELPTLLEGLKSTGAFYTSFKEVIRFRLLFIREKDDLKKFFYGFWALELLISKICKQALAATKQVLMEKNQHNTFVMPQLVKSLEPTQGGIEQRFEVMQIALLGSCNQQDLNTFKVIAEKRNHIAHGRPDDSSLEKLTEKLEVLLDKYLKLACHFDLIDEK